ncbi:MAG: recombination mediator RecR [Thermodesulfobacteriota bacterium]|nr:recombination mediator RecR [Thermodesulfobacteriota bacterium]
MNPYPKPLRNLVSQLKRLPGIGEKTASRLALYILGDKGDLAVRLAEALKEVKQNIRLCPVCFNITDKKLCAICQDTSRDTSIICVVEDPSDVLALEATHSFKGLYHVLHGLISPINGVGSDDIKLPELIDRIRKPSVEEVLIATNPSVEGESTSHYIHKMISDAKLPVQVSRIAYGIPMGAELKYMDQVTLSSALRYRRDIKDL